uniref:Uncharacterized protein n=1 Tax=Triticum urartu TaxID=4572 RepID=A0A8R7PG73_TRIUA
MLTLRPPPQQWHTPHSSTVSSHSRSPLQLQLLRHRLTPPNKHRRRCEPATTSPMTPISSPSRPSTPPSTPTSTAPLSPCTPRGTRSSSQPTWPRRASSPASPGSSKGGTRCSGPCSPSPPPAPKMPQQAPPGHLGIPRSPPWPRTRRRGSRSSTRPLGCRGRMASTGSTSRGGSRRRRWKWPTSGSLSPSGAPRRPRGSCSRPPSTSLTTCSARRSPAWTTRRRRSRGASTGST